MGARGTQGTSHTPRGTQGNGPLQGYPREARDNHLRWLPGDDVVGVHVLAELDVLQGWGRAGQGEIWDQVNPMGRSPVLGLVAQGTGSHARCVPAQQGPPKSGVPPHLAEHRLRLGQVEAAR